MWTNKFNAHAGAVMVAVQTKCASQHITVSVRQSHDTLSSIESEADSFTARDLPSHQQQQQQQPHQHGCSSPGVQLHVAVECLVISVWDDERRRLLGGRSQGSQGAAELCCIYWDRLSLCFIRTSSTGRVLQISLL